MIANYILHFAAKLICYKHTKSKTESRENLSRYESRHFFDGGFFICKNGGQKYESHEHCGLSQRYREEGSCYQQRHVCLADADGKHFTSSYREVHDGFSLSIQASSAHHCEKGENGIYKSVELGCLSSPEESLSEYEDWDDSSMYGYVPVEVADAIIAKHGGIILPD